MVSRRDALGSLALLVETLASGRPIGAQTQSGGQAPTASPSLVFKCDLPNVTLNGWEVTVSYVDYRPGRASPPHRHAGFVLAYVLQGAVVTKISDQGDERTYTTGQMFYEQPGATHEVSRNASATEPARLLAMIFAKKGETLTTLA